MWGASELHGDETSCAIEDLYACAGCFTGYPESWLGEKFGLQRVGTDRFCPTCRENMTCSRCSEYCESVDRSKGQSVCETCLEESNG